MQILQKWEKFVHAFPQHKKENAAHCLEAQVRFNESCNDGLFKTSSIPLMFRIISQSRAFKRNAFDFCDVHESISNSQSFVFQTRFLPHPSQSIQEHADYLGKLAHVLVKEFDQLFGDQYNKYIAIHGLECTNNDGLLILHYEML